MERSRFAELFKGSGSTSDEEHHDTGVDTDEHRPRTNLAHVLTPSQGDSEPIEEHAWTLWPAF
jgi:hypothetical protein